MFCSNSIIITPPTREVTKKGNVFVKTEVAEKRREMNPVLATTDMQFDSVEPQPGETLACAQ
jgi:hypothetical protein